MVARGALRLGHTVVVDAANYVEPASALWRSLAVECEVPLRWIEVVCSDEAIHRERLSSRERAFDASLEPRWEEVRARRAETEPWLADDGASLGRVDTAFAVAPQLRRMSRLSIRVR